MLYLVQGSYEGILGALKVPRFNADLSRIFTERKTLTVEQSEALPSAAFQSLYALPVENSKTTAIKSCLHVVVCFATFHDTVSSQFIYPLKIK